MNIIANVDVPYILTSLIEKNYEGVSTIKKVILDAFVLPNDFLAVFLPEDECITIDLGHCMTNKKWMNQGVTFVANVWLNILYSVFHELAHAIQLIEDPELIDHPERVEALEADAKKLARKAMFSWFNDGGKIPSLTELGWLGSAIAKTLNGLFDTHPNDVLEEMKALELGGVAKVDIVIATHDHFNDIPLLYSEIDKGNIGIKVGNKRYLTATEFMEA